MSDNKPIKLYTTRELAALFSKDVETIRRWIKNGQLPAKKIGGTYYIEEETLRGLLSADKPAEDTK